jgi:general secretion pathway protein D
MPTTQWRSGLRIVVPSLALSGLLAACASSSPPPTPSSPATAQAGAELPFTLKDPDRMISFSIEDADITEVTRIMSELTGQSFVIATDKAKTAKGTFVASEKISVAQAYKAFTSMLDSSGMVVVRDGTLLKIVDATKP